MKAEFLDVVFDGNDLRADAVTRLENEFAKDASLLDLREDGSTHLHQLAMWPNYDPTLLKQVVAKIIQLKPELLQVRWNGRILPIEHAVEQGSIAMIDALAPYYSDSIIVKVLDRRLQKYFKEAEGVVFEDDSDSEQQQPMPAQGRFCADLKIDGQAKKTLMSYALRNKEFGVAQALYNNGFTRMNIVAVSEDKIASEVLGEIANTFFVGKSTYDEGFCAFIKEKVIQRFKVKQLKDALVANKDITGFVDFVSSELEKRKESDKSTDKHDKYTLEGCLSSFLPDNLDREKEAVCEAWQIEEEEFVFIEYSALYFTRLLGSSFGKEAREAGAIFYEFKMDLSEVKVRQYFLEKILQNGKGNLDLNWVAKLSEAEIKFLTENDDIRKYLVDNYEQLQASLVAAENGEAATLHVVNSYLDKKFGKTNKQILDIKCLRDESGKCFLSCLGSGIDPRELVDRTGVITRQAVTEHQAYMRLAKDTDSAEYKTAVFKLISEEVQKAVSGSKDATAVEMIDANCFRRIFKDKPNRLQKAYKVLGFRMKTISALSSDRIDALFQDGFDIKKYIQLSDLMSTESGNALSYSERSNVLSEDEVFDLAKDSKKRDFLLSNEDNVEKLKTKRNISRNAGGVKKFKEILNLSTDAITFKFAYEDKKKSSMYGNVWGYHCSWSDLAKTISEHKIGAVSYGMYLAKCHVKKYPLEYIVVTPFVLLTAATYLYVYTGIDVVSPVINTMSPVINTMSLAKDHASKLLQPSIDVVRATLHL